MHIVATNDYSHSDVCIVRTCAGKIPHLATGFKARPAEALRRGDAAEHVEVGAPAAGRRGPEAALPSVPAVAEARRHLRPGAAAVGGV